jgi:hypothetical protein
MKFYNLNFDSIVKHKIPVFFKLRIKISTENVVSFYCAASLTVKLKTNKNSAATGQHKVRHTFNNFYFQLYKFYITNKNSC